MRRSFEGPSHTATPIRCAWKAQQTAGTGARGAPAPSSAVSTLRARFPFQLRLRTSRLGSTGTLKSFATAAMGMEQRPMMIEVSHMRQVSGMVCAKGPANSTMIVWMNPVKMSTCGEGGMGGSQMKRHTQGSPEETPRATIG